MWNKIYFGAIYNYTTFLVLFPNILQMNSFFMPPYLTGLFNFSNENLFNVYIKIRNFQA